MAEPPILDQVNLVVTDMEATVAFYRRLGLTIPDTDPVWQSHHRNAQLPGGIDLDFDSVTFARHWDKGWQGGMGVLGFKVDSRERVDEIYADLTGAGYAGQQEPYDAFWGARYAVVEDPDGNPVGDHEPHRPGPSRRPGLPVTAKLVERVRRICFGLPEAYEEETWVEATRRSERRFSAWPKRHDPAKPAVSLKATTRTSRRLDELIRATIPGLQYAVKWKRQQAMDRCPPTTRC